MLDSFLFEFAEDFVHKGPRDAEEPNEQAEDGSSSVL
jgi:hypothetical protein